MPGPLEGVRIVEIAGIGPAPLGVMLLADLGADVLRIDRIQTAKGQPGAEISMWGLNRNRRSIGLDLKSDEGIDLLRRLLDDADVLVEGMRPGVAERLGFGPDVCLQRNPRLVYARMTGWGQEGPLAPRAGHDIDYAAITGALFPIGRADQPPPPPLNLVADFGGGGTYLAMGVMAALIEREHSGEGQVVDVAMVDGVASLTSFFHGMMHLGGWSPQREANLLDGAAPFYATYETADGQYMAVGAIEPQFFSELLEKLGIEGCPWPQMDRSRWDDYHDEFARIFKQRTRDEWAEVFADSDACVSPVLALDEAPDHPHLVARDVFVEVDGSRQPAPAPRFSRTPGEVRSGPPVAGAHTDEVLAGLGLNESEIARLRDQDVVA